MYNYNITYTGKSHNSQQKVNGSWLEAIKEAISLASSVSDQSPNDKIVVQGHYSDVGIHGGSFHLLKFELKRTETGYWI